MILGIETSPARPAATGEHMDIVPNQRMAMDASIFDVGTDHSPLTAVEVLSVRHWFEVARVNAGFLTTKMVENQPVGNRTDKALVNHTMRNRATTLSVPVATDTKLPNPARSLIPPVLYKPIDRGRSRGMAVDVAPGLSLDRAVSFIRGLSNFCALTAAAVAESVWGGIVCVLHLIDLLRRSVRWAAARGVSAPPGFLLW